MKKTVVTMLSLAVLCGGLTYYNEASAQKKGATKSTNPLLQEWKTPYATPPFSQIKESDYLPAFKESINLHNKEIEAIISNKAKPTFDNTIAALDYSGKKLKQVSGVFGNLTSCMTNENMQKIQEQVGPMLSKHSDEINMNESLFKRVKIVWDNRKNEKYTSEQQQLLKKTYDRFVRCGALLNEEQKEELKDINGKITTLESKFENNLLKDTKKYTLEVREKEELKGLPSWLMDQAKAEGEKQGKPNTWVFTMDNPSVFPFLQYAANRDLRHKIYDLRWNRCNNNDANDNKEVIRTIVDLRAKKASILGYKTYADYVLEERMNKSPKEVYNLLESLLQYSLKEASKERDMYTEYLHKDGYTDNLEPWDWYYYADKVKADKFSFNEDETREYFEINNVRKGCFTTAGKLYGLKFEPNKKIETYQKDVTAYEVKNENNKTIGVLYFDPYTRDSKVGGAWCNNYRDQYKENGNNTIPILCVCFNFAKGTDGKSYLTADEASTIFHEMGHALNGLLSNCTYPSTSGLSTPEDFVEMPSQIYEHWTLEPEVLALYARNSKGELIPDDLVKKVNESKSFNSGFTMSELYEAAYLDIEYHVLTSGDQIGDIKEFENKTMKKIGAIAQIPARYLSTYFAHVFGGEYAVGYYSYVQSQVLDADAFQAFKEAGNIFDKKTADKLKNEVLSKGSSVEAHQMYRNFRGKDATIDALLKDNGIEK